MEDKVNDSAVPEKSGADILEQRRQKRRMFLKQALAAKKGRKKTFWRSFSYSLEYIALIVAILVFWLILGKAGKLNQAIMPSLGKILKKFWTLTSNGQLPTHLWISLRRVITGYLISAALGIFLGVLMGLSKHLETLTHLLVQIIKPIPPIAWIPLVILWFGIGETGKIFLIFLGGFFTILINVLDGIKQTDPKLLEVSKVMETPFLKNIFRVYIPSALPSICTGLRTGLSSCWMCVVAAELVCSTTGLGYMIMDARQYGQTDIVIVGMITIGIIGKIMDSLLHLMENKICRWHR